MNKKTSLVPYEWAVVCLLILLLILLLLVTIVSDRQIPPIRSSADYSSERIEVMVRGAVLHSGCFELSKGSKMKDLLDLCQPNAEANLTEIKPNSKLRDGQEINIPAKEWIVVYLSGAVSNQGAKWVLKGTTLHAFVDEIEFMEGADIEKLRKKRKLVDQEQIDVQYTKRKGLKKLKSR